MHVNETKIINTTTTKLELHRENRTPITHTTEEGGGVLDLLVVNPSNPVYWDNSSLYNVEEKNIIILVIVYFR